MEQLGIAAHISELSRSADAPFTSLSETLRNTGSQGRTVKEQLQNRWNSWESLHTFQNYHGVQMHGLHHSLKHCGTLAHKEELSKNTRRTDGTVGNRCTHFRTITECRCTVHITL